MTGGGGVLGRGVSRADAQDYLYARLAEIGETIAAKRGADRVEARKRRDFLREQQKIAHAERGGVVRLHPELERAVREWATRVAGRRRWGYPAGNPQPRQKRASTGAPARGPAKGSAGAKASTRGRAEAKTRRGRRAEGEGGRSTLGLRDQVMVIDGSHWAYGQIGRVIALTPKNATIRLRKRGGLHSIRELGPALEVGRDQLRSMEPE